MCVCACADRAEAELQDFSPYYRGQYSAARFAQVEEDLEPRKEKITQLLKQKVRRPSRSLCASEGHCVSLKVVVCPCCQQEVAEDGEVLYEDGLLYFDENRKWRERYVVVRANYCLECHDGLEVRTAATHHHQQGAQPPPPHSPFSSPPPLQTFLKGVPPRHKLLPTGGAVFTTEEKYMAAVDKCFPDDSST